MYIKHDIKLLQSPHMKQPLPPLFYPLPQKHLTTQQKTTQSTQTKLAINCSIA